MISLAYSSCIVKLQHNIVSCVSVLHLIDIHAGSLNDHPAFATTNLVHLEELYVESYTQQTVYFIYWFSRKIRSFVACIHKQYSVLVLVRVLMNYLCSACILAEE